MKIRKLEMDGLPLLDAEEKLALILDPDNFLHAAPGNGDDCAIALGCQRQLSSPFVHIARTMAYVALPDEEHGRELPGKEGKWVMRRFRLSAAAKKAVKEVDTRKAHPAHSLIELLPPIERLGSRDPKRGHGGAHAQKSRGIRVNVLDQEGVRNYSGRLPH